MICYSHTINNYTQILHIETDRCILRNTHLHLGSREMGIFGGWLVAAPL